MGFYRRPPRPSRTNNKRWVWSFVAATPINDTDTGGTGGSTLLDDFNRADGALGSNWFHPDVGGNMPLISTNRAIVTNSGETGACWNTIFSQDQEATLQFTGSASGGEHVYILLDVTAASPTAFTGYLLDLDILSSSLATATVYRANAGGFTSVFLSASIAFAATDTWTLRRSGSSIHVLRNSASVASSPQTDSSPLSGSGYVGFGGRLNSTLLVDFFSGGSSGSGEVGSVTIAENIPPELVVMPPYRIYA